MCPLDHAAQGDPCAGGQRRPPSALCKFLGEVEERCLSKAREVARSEGEARARGRFARRAPRAAHRREEGS